MILAYILALVPLNWLICRYVLGRREWAWVVVPALSLAFAVGVERAAAYDVGYDSSCDEIDLIETHGDYTRGHLSRFASVYSTGRVKFTISYPNDPTALALPLSTGPAAPGRGDRRSRASRPLPIPGPDRVPGPAPEPGPVPGRADGRASRAPSRSRPRAKGRGSIINESGLDLNDAWVVEVRTQPDEDQLQAVSLGAIAAGAKVPLGTLEDVEPKATRRRGPARPRRRSSTCS